MNRKFLSQIEDLNREVEDIKKRLEKIVQKPDKIVIDSVSGSSPTFPYIKHSCVVEGIDTSKDRNMNKYKKILEKKKDKLQKKIIQLEYELYYIEDSDLRKIIRHKYIDGMNWVQIMFEMRYDSESKARMKLKRFLEQEEKSLKKF